VADPQGDLPYAQVDIEAIGALFDETKVYQGERARTEDFLTNIGRSDVIHFAAHGFYDTNDPLRSGLKLAWNESLTVEDVLSLEVKPGIVVLSACESGLSEVTPGGEPLGLAQAFLSAGASSVIAWLWGVHDESAAYLLRSFYRHLMEQNLPVAEALRRAQLELIRAAGAAEIPWPTMVLYGDWK